MDVTGNISGAWTGLYIDQHSLSPFFGSDCLSVSVYLPLLELSLFLSDSSHLPITSLQTPIFECHSHLESEGQQLLEPEMFSMEPSEDCIECRRVCRLNEELRVHGTGNSNLASGSLRPHANDATLGLCMRWLDTPSVPSMSPCVDADTTTGGVVESPISRDPKTPVSEDTAPDASVDTSVGSLVGRPSSKRRRRPSSEGNESARARGRPRRFPPLHTFKCTEEGCDMEFRDQYRLVAHRRVHTGATPFSCDFPSCGRAFRWRSSLVSHMNTHRRHGSDKGGENSVTGTGEGGRSGVGVVSSADKGTESEQYATTEQGHLR